MANDFSILRPFLCERETGLPAQAGRPVRREDTLTSLLGNRLGDISIQTVQRLIQRQFAHDRLRDPRGRFAVKIARL